MEGGMDTCYVRCYVGHQVRRAKARVLPLMGRKGGTRSHEDQGGRSTDAGSTSTAIAPDPDQGRFGHEFLEFEVYPEGIVRYANVTRYRGEGNIRKELRVTPNVVAEFARIVRESKVCHPDPPVQPRRDAA